MNAAAIKRRRAEAGAERRAQHDAEDDQLAADLLGFCWRLWGTVCGESPSPVAPTVPRHQR